MADPVVVALEFLGGVTGYGETLPRSYVTGETVESVLANIQNVLAPLLLEFRPASFADALEAADALPWRDQTDNPIPAARAAVELAILDGMMRYFHRNVDDIVRWMGLPRFGTPGSQQRIRFSGVLAAENSASTIRTLRKMYWGGLRQFKLKVGFDGDLEILRAVARYLQRPLRSGAVSLRLDANGAWTLAQSIDWLKVAPRDVFEGLEQPMPPPHDAHLPELIQVTDACIVHDESLVTTDDAQRLIDLGVAGGFNIRISKCGGLMPALRLAALAKRHGVRIQLGCMVGETSLLSAAGLRFLAAVPNVHWAEGCFGRFLLADDVFTPSLHFGLGGRPPRVRGAGLGVLPNEGNLARYGADDPFVLNL